jgi:RNA-directed DNA polymerase
LWINYWREKRSKGEVIVVHYADDFVIGFEHEDEAQACLDALRVRFAKFGSKLHTDKTRLIEFGRYASERREKLGDKRPETFDFLGFTHQCAKTKKDACFIIHRHSIGKRMRSQLLEIRIKLRK